MVVSERVGFQFKLLTRFLMSVSLQMHITTETRRGFSEFVVLLNRVCGGLSVGCCGLKWMFVVLWWG